MEDNNEVDDIISHNLNYISDDQNEMDRLEQMRRDQFSKTDILNYKNNPIKIYNVNFILSEF